MRVLYSCLLYALLPAVLLRLAWLGVRDRGYWRRWPERLGFVAPRSGSAPLVWLHAVSVGEVQASRPLIERLRRERPDLDILVTTTTPTGAAVLGRAFDEAVVHRWFPYDLPGAVARFLARTRPALVVLMETELWPNLITACAARGVPVVLANARMSPRSFARYRLGGALTRATLAGLAALTAQSRGDAERLLALGAPAARLSVAGSIKFDARIPASLREQAEPLRRDLGVDRPVLIAASTHAGEDEVVLEAFVRVRERFAEALLLLVPRHPERADRVAELCRARGLEVARRSRSASPAGTDVFLGDTVGELPLFYAAADVAFVGGSLTPVGGHNVLEPAALGLPVLTGPHTFNFAEITAMLAEAGAVGVVRDAAELACAVEAYFADAQRRVRAGDAGRAVVEANRGAVERVWEAVSPLLPAPPTALSAASRTPP